ncbi:MAG: hypothetical protein AMJ69_02680 [Gammaproteobacteria bacterium SG8_47]|nr:MAG: hypothetical protein AMJ69_02680 [Gammaproteobacteria bacterium SG8_47]
MSGLTRSERRVNRKHVLDALHQETGSNGGDAAAARVEAFRADPIGAPTTEFAYVGALTLTRFYVDPSKPNANERRSLWMNITQRMQKPGTTDPGGWDGTTDVKQLQALAENA